jgi:hypothetical protein
VNAYQATDNDENLRSCVIDYTLMMGMVRHLTRERDLFLINRKVQRTVCSTLGLWGTLRSPVRSVTKLQGDWLEGEVEDNMEGEGWVGGSEGFEYACRYRGVDSPITHHLNCQ